MKRIHLYLLFTAALFAACKKETEPMPYAEIEQFTINDANGNALKASVANGQVILYWPPYNAVPTTITPQIVVSPNAVISPASGTAVEFKDNVTFTVTAQNGTKKVYTLKTVVNQPAVTVEDMPVNATYYLGNPFDLWGEYMVGNDSSATRIFITDKNNKETELDRNEATRFGPSRISIPMPLKVGVDSGYYSVRVVVGNYVKQMPNKVYVSIPAVMAVIKPAADAKLRKGQPFTFNIHEVMVKYLGMPQVASVRIYSGITSTYTDVPNVTLGANNSITFTVPANLAYTATSRIRFYNASGGLIFQYFNSTQPIPITE